MELAMPSTILSAFVVLLFAMLPVLFEGFASVLEAADRRESQLRSDYRPDILEEFDFIIVGGGSAGSVVANRLSADPTSRVLVIEEGGDPNPFFMIPCLDSVLFDLQPPSMVSVYKTTKQAGACLHTDGICEIPVGKGLGGSGEVNGLNYLRGSPDDLNEWARISGDPVWNYKNALPAFTKSEDYNGFNKNPGEFHGSGGELHISEQGNSKFMDYFYAAGKENSLSLRDFNSQFLKGYGPVDHNTKGIRWGPYNAFLKPILDRPNLTIYRYSKATKIHLTAEGKASGVSYVRHGIQRFVGVKKEIILSAGAIGSPRLLLLSGIGPRKDLEAVGITVEVDLPVGKRFKDRVEGVQIEFSINQTLSFSPERDLTVQDLANFIVLGKGPLAVPHYEPTGAVYTSSSGVEKGDPRPDLELLMSPLEDKFKVIPLLLRPESIGEIRLASKDPADAPFIDPNYFGTPSDMKRLLEGVAYALEFVSSSPTFQRLNARLAARPDIPGCEGKVPYSPDYWECYIRHQTMTSYHMFGSCQMGRENDPEAVVDSRLRVRHTSGLRVIDNSVIPGVVTGHTFAAATMIGEMGSSFILGDN